MTSCEILSTKPLIVPVSPLILLMTEPVEVLS